MVLPVRDENSPTAADRDALQTLELPLGGTPAPKAAKERPIRVEDLDTVVAAVGDKDVALIVDGNTPERIKRK